MNRTQGKIEVSAVVVNYNDKVHLKECLASLERSSRNRTLEMIIVDNDSSDGSQEFIKSHFPRVKLISNRDNRGFAIASNQGIRESQGEFLLFLNTDTILQSEALGLMLDEMKIDLELGAVGPALLRGKNRYQVSFGNKVNFWSELIQKGFFNFYDKIRLKHDKGKREVGWLSAACLMVRRKALEEANFFDENFFLYFEDIDLCFKLRQEGWKLLYLPKAQVFHKGGSTTSSLAITSRYEYRKSQLYFYRKHNSKFSHLLLRVYLFLNFSLLFLLSFLSEEREAKDKKKFFKLLRSQKSKNRE